MDCHSLLQGIFLTQGLNLGRLHCRQIIYHLSHKESLLNSNVSLEMSDTVNADSFTFRLHVDCKRAKLYTHIHITILFIDYQIISDLMSYTNHWPAAGSVKDNKICFVHEEHKILMERQMSHIKLLMA